MYRKWLYVSLTLYLSQAIVMAWSGLEEVIFDDISSVASAATSVLNGTATGTSITLAVHDYTLPSQFLGFSSGAYWVSFASINGELACTIGDKSLGSV